jgi:LmbE family N-acetylglucosaminyl deacetylase
MTHLFLSPHLDDVILSCGGTLYELIQQGHSVAIHTLMAGDAPNPLPFSDLIDKIHARWRLGKNPSAARRGEEVIALLKYNLPASFGNWMDAIYREDSTYTILYKNDDDLFGDIHPQDPLLQATLDLAAREDIQALYVPLAAGNHVDHQLVRRKALEWLGNYPALPVFFYEEYPYGSERGEVYRSHAGMKKRLSGNEAVDYALQSLTRPLAAHVTPISEDALQTKIAAIQCYASQISSFWASPAEMAQSVIAYAKKIGESVGLPSGERFWIFI